MAFFAGESEVTLRSLQPEVIHRFLISRGQQCCRISLSTECSSLRGYLAYLHRCGAVALDLSRVVVAPRVYQHDRCPRFLTRPQIDAVLAVIDRTTRVGRRDYAMLMLLTAYGLRARKRRIFAWTTSTGGTSTCIFEDGSPGTTRPIPWPRPWRTPLSNTCGMGVPPVRTARCFCR